MVFAFAALEIWRQQPQESLRKAGHVLETATGQPLLNASVSQCMSDSCSAKIRKPAPHQISDFEILRQPAGSSRAPQLRVGPSLLAWFLSAKLLSPIAAGHLLDTLAASVERNRGDL